MRIAWITPYLPEPANSGGRIRISAFARALAAEELVLFARCSHNDPVPRDGQSVGPFVRTFARPAHPREFRVLPKIPSVVRTFPEVLSHMIAEEHRQNPWDVVIVEHCYAYVGLPSLPGACVVLNEHNIESEYWRRRLLRKAVELPENIHQYAIWRRYERNSWRSVDAVTVVSQRDSEAVRRVRPDSGIVFPNGVQLEGRRYLPPSARTGSRVLFLGTMDYEPNVRAAEVLAREVLPELRALVPDATLTLAGRDPTPSVKALAGADVRVTGTVADLGALFDEHAVFAMPIELGAGSSLKALDALSTGLPLVASPFAVRGHPLESGVHYVGARGPKGIAAALASVLTQRAAFDGIAAAGRSVAESLSWNAIATRFGDWVRETRASS